MKLALDYCRFLYHCVAYRRRAHRVLLRTALVLALGLVILPTSGSVSAADGDPSDPSFEWQTSCVLIIPTGQAGQQIALSDTFTIKCNYSGLNGWTSSTSGRARGPYDGVFPKVPTSWTPATPSSSTTFDDTFQFYDFAAGCGFQSTFCNNYNRVVVTSSTVDGDEAVQSTYRIDDLPNNVSAVWPLLGVVDDFTVVSSAAAPARWQGTIGGAWNEQIGGGWSISDDPLDTPQVQFEGADNYDPYVANPPAECKSSTIFVQLADGEEQYVPGDLNVQYRNMAPGEELILVVSQLDTKPESGWAIRPSPSRPFTPMILIDTATSGGVRATSWSYRYTAETPLFSVEFKCIDETGSAYFGLDTSFVGDDPTPASICRALVANLPEETTISDGDDLTIGFVLPDGDYFDGDTGLNMIIAGAYSWDAVETRNSFGTLIGGSMAPYTHHVFEGTRGTITFTNVVKTAGEANVDYPARYIRFACADSYAGYQRVGVEGELPPWVTWTPLTPLGDYTYREGGLGECFNFPDMSLTSPASWVAGVGGMFVCIARELFVPDSEVLLVEFVELNGTLEDRPPFIAFYELVAFADTANDSFQAGSGGCYSVGQVVTLEGAVGSTNNYCPGAAVSTDTGQRSLLTAFFVGPMILGLAAHMLGLVRGSKEQELVAT